MEHLAVGLNKVKQISDKEKNIAAKRAWLCAFREVWAKQDSQAEFDALKTCLSGYFPVSFLSAVIDGVILGSVQYNEVFLNDVRRKFPLLNETLEFRGMNSEERKDFFWHREHPVSVWIDQICRGPKRTVVRKVMPFYLCDRFIHKEKPLRPFERSSSRFSPNKLAFKGEISFSANTNANRYQNSHHDLYQGILNWCDCYFPDEYDRSLCHALYTFNRPHLVAMPPSQETHNLPNHLYALYQGLLQVFDFDIAMLPQYAQTTISTNEFNSFFYIDTTPDVKAVRKSLYATVTEEVALEYMDLAFLDPSGFGHSRFPRDWHYRIEDWLACVINSDQTLCEYVNMPDDLNAPNLAQVELAIQFICCEHIKSIMSKNVLKLYKRVLGPADI